MSIFLYHDWMSLPLETRIKLADQFGIKKTSPTHVFDNRIESDGYSIRDVEKALNLPAIQSYLLTEETDLQKLWPMIVDKINGKMPPVIAPTPEATPIPVETIKQEVSQAPTAQAVEEVPPVKSIKTKKK